MSSISSVFGNIPGMGSVVETYEAAIAWGPFPRLYTGGYIASTALDPTNTPTWELRIGLVMGLNSSGWVNYSPTATDGSQVARGILPVSFRIQNVLTGVAQPLFWGIMVSGGVQGSKLIGLDNQARAQLSNRFVFDDSVAPYPTQPWTLPWNFVQNKTANYAIVATDNLSLFTTLAAAGEVDFTLPAIANGYAFGFSCQADQTLKVISNEGGNMLTFNSLVGSSVAFSTGGSRIGGFFLVYSNSAATKWVVENHSVGANTVTST